MTVLSLVHSRVVAQRCKRLPDPLHPCTFFFISLECDEIENCFSHFSGIFREYNEIAVNTSEWNKLHVFVNSFI